MYNILQLLPKSFFELIDTLWNVNKDGPEVYQCKRMELIDTLWNVNFTGSCMTNLELEAN